MPGMAAGAARKIPWGKRDPGGGAEQTHPENKGRLCYHLLSHDFKCWNMAAGQKHPCPIITSTPGHRGGQNGTPPHFRATRSRREFSRWRRLFWFCYFSKSNAKALLTAGAYQKCLAPCGAYIPNRSACVPVRSNLNSFPICL